MSSSALTPAILKRIESDLFDHIVSLSRMKPLSRSMARRVLVDGVSPTEVAKEFGVIRQRVTMAVDVVRRIHGNTGVLQPGGWVTVSLVLPAELARGLQNLTEAIQAAESEDDRAAAIARVRAALNGACHQLKYFA